MSDKSKFNVWLTNLRQILDAAISDLSLTPHELDVLVTGIIRGMKVEEINEQDKNRRRPVE